MLIFNCSGKVVLCVLFLHAYFRNRGGIFNTLMLQKIYLHYLFVFVCSGDFCITVEIFPHGKRETPGKAGCTRVFLTSLTTTERCTQDYHFLDQYIFWTLLFCTSWSWKKMFFMHVFNNCIRCIWKRTKEWRLDRRYRPKKTGETVGRRQNNGNVEAVSPRHCAATSALRNRQSSEIQGTALGKCLQAWPVYIQVHACGWQRRVVTLLLRVHWTRGQDDGYP